MRDRVAISLTLLAVASAALLEACSTRPEEVDHREALVETLQAAGRAIAAGDIDGLLSRWTDDVVIYPVAEPPVRGKEAVRRYVLRNRGQGIRPRIAPSDIVASVAGDIGYVVGTHDWVNDEGEASMPGRYVTLWRRTEEGRWQMFLEIHSPDPESEASGHAGPCDQYETSAQLGIDRERIGPYPAAVTLNELRTLCPLAEETLGSGFESVWAALDLSVGELTILAGQNWLSKAMFDDPGPDPRPDWHQAPSHWVVRGCGGQLPRAVSSCGTWSDLVTAFGLEGEGYAEFGPVLVRLDSLPGFQIRLSVTDEVVGSIEVHQDLSRIPLDARIEEIVVAPGGAG